MKYRYLIGEERGDLNEIEIEERTFALESRWGPNELEYAAEEAAENEDIMAIWPQVFTLFDECGINLGCFEVEVSYRPIYSAIRKEAK